MCCQKQHFNGNGKDTERQLYSFIGVAPGYAEDVMLTFFWLDEDDRSTIHLFQLVRNPGKCNASDDKSVRYYDNDDWPAFALTFSERLNSNSNEAHEKIAKPTIKGTLITIHIIRYSKKIIKI